MSKIDCCLFCKTTTGFYVLYVAPVNVGICQACNGRLIREALVKKDLLPELVVSLGEPA